MLEEELRAEIRKWAAKLAEERKHTELAGPARMDFIKNIDAYIADSAYFLEQGKLIQSFEALIWGWAFITIGKDVGILKKVH
jgi:hypothetical protein